MTGSLVGISAGVDTLGTLISGCCTNDTSRPWWGADGPHGPLPVFVATHRADVQAPSPSIYRCATTGIEDALAQAPAAAYGKHVRTMGGASLGQQYLADGLVDEIVLHIAPVVLGDGQRLFEDDSSRDFRREPVEDFHAPDATHVRYLVRR